MTERRADSEQVDKNTGGLRLDLTGCSMFVDMEFVKYREK